ncbi:MAG: (d)CMP kinase [Clostridia bacterium]|nr:(d)CMP kinase [Clostridia bacterium]
MINIAIDGPSGAGKSTLAKYIAAALGLLYLDTGALYRAVGLYALRHGVDVDDPVAVEQMLPCVHLELRYENGSQVVLLCGENVSSAIREHRVSDAASRVSAIPAVRTFLLEQQRSIARTHHVVMDGRDIGTVVLPDAQVKIFLVSDYVQRAKRRALELEQRGQQVELETLIADMKQRDARDSSRQTAPLVPARDAVHLDNSTLDRRGTVEAALDIIRRQLGQDAYTQLRASGVEELCYTE